MDVVRAGLYLIGLIALLMGHAAKATESFTEQGARSMDIVFEVGGERITAALEDTGAARAFIAMLPLNLELTDFGDGTEKVADLPGRLPTDDAPDGMQPVAGDITYYSPWGNLAIFRKAFSYSKGLVKLGRFTSSFAAIDRSGSIHVTVRREE